MAQCHKGCVFIGDVFILTPIILTMQSLMWTVILIVITVPKIKR